MATVLSTYHDRLLCPFEEYRDFLDYMVGTHVMLHDVARARRAVADALRKQLGELAHVEGPPEKTDSGNAGRYVKTVIKTLGYERVQVTPLKAGAFQVRTVAEHFA